MAETQESHDNQPQQNGGAAVHPSAHAGVKQARDKYEAKKRETKATKDNQKQPAGGFDSTPIPPVHEGYTVRFVFHGAKNLPIADIGSRSSDPFVEAELQPKGLKRRHAEDPPLVYRTPTIQKNCDPQWNVEWIVGNIPKNGFVLKCKIMDEDPSDHDDRLGDISVEVDGITEGSPAVKEQSYKIKKKRGSKRAYLFRGFRACLSQDVDMHGIVILSIEFLGRTKGDAQTTYTIGPNYWRQHYSPLLGRIAGTKGPDENSQSKAERYNFEANEMQLSGPIPPELYHRFVEFKPFVKGMFTGKGIRGILLNRALHHQHNRIYIYDKNTKFGVCQPRSDELTRRFLELVHWDRGARVYTYVLSLDGLFRFTETGKEFGIDLLSKHTMHSDVARYIACSGEFLIKRRKVQDSGTAGSSPSSEHAEGGLSRLDNASSIQGNAQNPESAERKNSQSSPRSPDSLQRPEPSRSAASSSSLGRDPSQFTLIIDNDSGTYRPKGDLLGHLKTFICENFPGLRVKTMECTDDKLQEMKEAQRAKKKRVGYKRQFVQNDSSSEDFSSSDEEALDERTKGQERKPKGRMGKGVQNAMKPERAFKDWVVGDHERARAEEEEDQAAVQTQQSAR